jgi:hypothetical protein
MGGLIQIETWNSNWTSADCREELKLGIILDGLGQPVALVNMMDKLLKLRAHVWWSVQYHGGTNFGRTSDEDITTSYDYDAPLDEYGMLCVCVCVSLSPLCLSHILYNTTKEKIRNILQNR